MICMLNCLKGNNTAAKEKLFYHNTVYPVAHITRSEIFREKITEYVNSKESGKDGRIRHYIPTQYTLSYVNDDNLGISHQVMMAIKAINRTELRQAYAEEVYREVIWGEVAELQIFSELLKTELPDVNRQKLDKHIDNLKFRKRLENELIGAIKLIDHYGGYRVYYLRESKELIITIGNKSYTFGEPYALIDLNIPFVDDLPEFNDFLCSVISFITAGKAYFNNVDQFKHYVKYCHLLHWEVERSYEERTSLFDYFFDKFELTVENIREFDMMFDRQWHRKLYSMSGKGKKLEWILNADLSITEKIKILSCIEISRKYLGPVRKLVSEYIRRDPDPEMHNYNLAYGLMERI